MYSTSLRGNVKDYLKSFQKKIEKTCIVDFTGQTSTNIVYQTIS